MRCLDGITNSMDMSLSKFREIVKDRGVAFCDPWGNRSQTLTLAELKNVTSTDWLTSHIWHYPKKKGPKGHLVENLTLARAILIFEWMDAYSGNRFAFPHLQSLSQHILWGLRHESLIVNFKMIDAVHLPFYSTLLKDRLFSRYDLYYILILPPNCKPLIVP